MNINKLLEKQSSLRSKIQLEAIDIKEQYKDLPASALLTIINSKLAKKHKKLQEIEYKIYKNASR